MRVASKSHRSPFSVSYDDLIRSCEARLKWMEENYPGMVTAQKMSSWTAQHNIAVETAKLRLMKRFKRNPQADLFAEHERSKQ